MLRHLPSSALKSGLGGAGLCLLFLALEAAAVRSGWLRPLAYATGARAWFPLLPAAALLFLHFALAAAWTARRLARGAPASEADSPPFQELLAQWARRDAAALGLLALYPFARLLPRLFDFTPAVPPFLLEKMRAEGLGVQDRMTVYAVGAWLLLVLTWKSLCLLRLLAALARERWDAARPGLALLAAAVFTLTGLWATAEYPPTGDEPHYLLTAHSLLHDHDLRLANNYANRDYRGFRDRLEPQQGMADGGLVANQEVAFPLLITPAYALGGRLGVVLFQNLLALCVVWNLSALLRGLLRDPRAALLATAAATLLPPFQIYASQVYPETAASLLVVLGLRQGFSTSLRHLRRLAPFAGVLLALPLLKTRYALPAFSLLVVALARRRPRGPLLFVLPALLALALLALFGLDQRYLGGYAYLGKFKVVVADLFTRYSAGDYLRFLSSSLFDQAGGLFPYAPLLLLAIPGMAAGFRLHRRQTVLLGQFLFLYAVLKSPYWQAGWSPPGRYFVCLVPALAVFVGRALEAEERRLRFLAAPLAAAAAASAFLLTALPPLRYPLPDGRGTLPVLLEKTTRLPWTAWVPYQHPGPGQARDLLAPLAAVVLLAGLGFAAGRRPAAR